MAEQNLTIANPSRLRARPATQVVNFVETYEGTVEIARGETTGNLKSTLPPLSMGLHAGTEATLRVDGPDETEYTGALAAFILNLEA